MISFISNRDNGLTMNAMVKVFWNMGLAKSMKENGKTTNTLQKFSPVGDGGSPRPKASATGSLNILVGLTLKPVYFITV